MNVCIICAHPDDELFGAFSLVKHFKRKNYNVTILNVFSHYQHNSRLDSFKSVCNHLEVQYLSCNLEALRDYSIAYLADVIKQTVTDKPDIVCTHLLNDMHQDHVIVAKATQIAYRKFEIRQFVEFPVISSTDQLFTSIDYNLFIPITYDEFKELCDLVVQFYSDQLKHIRTLEFIESMYRYYGHSIGVDYAYPNKLSFSICT